MRKAVYSLLTVVLAASSDAADWPQYRCDAGRSGYTAEALPAQLTLLWTYEAGQAPQPAWPRSGRMTFDRAFQPVIAGDTLYFGSSADGKVYALDAATGAERWSYTTDGPVRFAPAVWKDRLFVASDDGYLHCLSGRSGELLWKRRGGSGDRRVLGNERMMSLWPVRGGPVVEDDTVYFAAGIWPSEGVFIQAVDPRTGARRWLNDDSGFLRMAQPHGGAYARSGPAAQGYLAAAGTRLFVPTGRAVPAVFDRGDGKFLYFHLQKYGQKGGSLVVATDVGFFNNGLSFLSRSGERLGSLGGQALAVTPEAIVRSSEREMAAYRLVEKEIVDRKGRATRRLVPERSWTQSHEGRPNVPVAAPSPPPPGDGVGELIVAAQTAVVAFADTVVTFDLEKRQALATLDVEGTAYGLAAANGRLYASTHRGRIHCFGEGPPGETPRRVTPSREASPYGRNDRHAAAAAAILERTGIQDGYCLDLGCGDGALSFELARRSRLKIYAIDSDPDRVAEARRKLQAAGLYGSRVTVHRGDLEATGYPQHFANLIVSARSVEESRPLEPTPESRRLLRPYGGVMCTGAPGALAVTERGPLPGAGTWTHQYSDPANTSCSDDVHVKGDLEILWFRDVDQPVPQRHGRGPAPLFSSGRLFSEGLDSLVAIDAYNGHLLWRHPLKGILRAYHGDHLMGTSGTGSNYCVSGGSVYVRRDDHCLRIDAASGQLLGRFEAPRAGGEPGIWGYLACEDGVLYGSLADPQHIVTYRYQRGGDLTKQLTESRSLFALDATTGARRWHHIAEHSVRNNAIAIGGGRLYFVDRPLASADRQRKPKSSEPQPLGKLIALDTRDGREVWRSEKEVFGTLLALSVRHGALLMAYQDTRFKLASEVGGRLAALSAADGYLLWDRKDVKYVTRPLINGRTIYAQGGAWDLLTGEDRPFHFKRSYGCGQLASGASMLLYRSATLGYFDLEENKENRDFGGVRPGCWINAIPAGGMVLVPDASAGCACSYLNQSWIALRPVQR